MTDTFAAAAAACAAVATAFAAAAVLALLHFLSLASGPERAMKYQAFTARASTAAQDDTEILLMSAYEVRMCALHQQTAWVMPECRSLLSALFPLLS